MYTMYAEGVPDLHANEPVLRFHTHPDGDQFDVHCWAARFAELLDSRQRPNATPWGEDSFSVRTVDPVVVVSSAGGRTTIGSKRIDGTSLLASNPLVLPEQERCVRTSDKSWLRPVSSDLSAISAIHLELFHEGLTDLVLGKNTSLDESSDHTATLFGEAAIREAFSYFHANYQLSLSARDQERQRRLLVVASTALFAADIDPPQLLVAPKAAA